MTAPAFFVASAGKVDEPATAAILYRKTRMGKEGCTRVKSLRLLCVDVLGGVVITREPEPVEEGLAKGDANRKP